MPQLCQRVFTVHSIYTIFFKSSLLPVFRLLVIEQIYIFIGLFMYHNGHCMFNIHNILEICFPSKSSGDWLSLYRQYILLNFFFNISGSDQNKTQTIQNIKLGMLQTQHNKACYNSNYAVLLSSFLYKLLELGVQPASEICVVNELIWWAMSNLPVV